MNTLKKISLLVAFMCLSLVVAYSQDSNQVMGPGPVVAISQTYSNLPQQIQNFISKNFPNIAVVETEYETLASKYEVKLNNGYELTFLTDGQWIEIEAPKNVAISHKLLKFLLPIGAYKYLESQNLLNRVNEVTYNLENGFKCDFVKTPDVYFNLGGQLINGNANW